MDERQKENWSGVLLALMVVGFLLGGWLLLRFALHEGWRATRALRVRRLSHTPPSLSHWLHHTVCAAGSST